MEKNIRIAGVVFFLAITSLPGFAQDAEEISDDQLWKYALMQEVIDQMKKDISIEINALIKAQEGMTGKRYTELEGAKGDADALAALEAQEWEIKFLDQVTKLKEERIEAIKSVNTDLAIKMVGDRGRTYKAIKDLLGSDATVKSRYDVIRAGIKQAAEQTDL